MLSKLYRDPHGVIWIGGIEGLFRLDQAGRIVPVPLPGRGKLLAIPGEKGRFENGTYVTDMSMDVEGQLWVGYQGGVARCMAETCVAVIGPEHGLIDPRIRTVAVAPGEVWVCYRGSRGYSRFQQRQGGWVPTHFRPQDGFGPLDTHFV